MSNQYKPYRNQLPFKWYS